jgi:hypothetical protein
MISGEPRASREDGGVRREPLGNLRRTHLALSLPVSRSISGWMPSPGLDLRVEAEFDLGIDESGSNCA